MQSSSILFVHSSWKKTMSKVTDIQSYLKKATLEISFREEWK